MPTYVQHEVLGKVNDVFNADALWQAPGLALFSRRPLLRDLLERSPREHRGRAATRCFSHVTLMLPQEEVDDDRHLARGARARDLVHSLAALHQKDFGDLLGQDEVRYDVVGAAELAPGHVEIKFGHAVYLPAAEEKILYSVSVSRDSVVWKPVCPVYPDQRLTLIGQDEESASFAVPAWPFGGDGAILLINDGPDKPLEVQMRPKESFEAVFDAQHGYYSIKSRRGGIDAQGSAPRLLLKITRVSVPSAQATKLSAVWKPRELEAEGTALPTSARPAPAMSDATFAPLATQRVSLAALALPRLSRYRDASALALEVGLDERLGIAASTQQAIISFAVDAADELYAQTPEGRQLVRAPSSFTPMEGRTIELQEVAPRMADRYRALLCLPDGPSQHLAGSTRLAFGRGAPALANLRVLDAGRFLRCSEGASNASADRIGLSRLAFSFEAAGKAFKIAKLSPTQALYHLDEQLHYVATLSEASAEQPYLLPSGHHLVAGHYVLRFEA